MSNSKVWDDIEQLIGEQVDVNYETHKADPSEYNEGYLDGLRQAYSLLEEKFKGVKS